jgi:Rrf2 family protein
MLRISRRAEYGIIAAQFMARKDKRLVSVKEISDSMDLSFDFLSKTLQALLKTGIVVSQKGVRGGYKLARKPEKISLHDIIDSLEEKKAIVECLEPDGENCDKSGVCTIKDPLFLLQSKIDKLFSDTSIAEIAKEKIHKSKCNDDNNKVNYDR